MSDNIDDLKFHKRADLFPMLDDTQSDELAHDMTSIINDNSHSEAVKIAEVDPLDHSANAGAWTSHYQSSYDEYVANNSTTHQNSNSAPQGHQGLLSRRAKPKLRVDKSNPDETVDNLADIMASSRKVYVRDGLVSVLHEHNSGAAIKRLDVEDIIYLAHQICRPYLVAYKDGSFIETNTSLPRSIASIVMSNYIGKGFPYLKAITSSPIIYEHGEIHCQNGYDPRSKYYYDNVPDISTVIPENPSFEEARVALQKLREAFQTFPFADAETTEGEFGVNCVDLTKPPRADESTGLTALLTAIARPSLEFSPGFIVSAAEISGAGTGKGKFVRCICAIAYEWQPSAVTAGPNSEELEKRLAAELIESSPCVLIDNANGLILKSDLLASAITEQRTKTRILGKTQMHYMTTSSLIVLTGNGLRVSEDLARRFVEVRFDARTEDPERRHFNGDIVAGHKSRRAELMAAGLTILRFGRKNLLPFGVPLGGFEQWCRWVRDPLLALGCVDPVLRVSEAKHNDLDRQRKIHIFDAWWRSHGDRPVKAAELSNEVLQILNPQNKGRQYIAKAVQSLSGVRIGGYYLQRANTDKSLSSIYALQRCED